ncbi:TRM-domain-containing protein [Xylariomycetidae sp. FL0641]|nr:TRM-domain-containing protein [Xylariomycetidae sp. FL0641]
MATEQGTSSASTSAPTPQTIVRDGNEYTEVKEGLARILVPAPAKDAPKNMSQDAEDQQSVFYNPIQQFNRDLTVLAIKAYGEEAISQRRSANAQHVAKRKRDKSDASGRDSKKQQTANAKGAQDPTSTTDGAQKEQTEKKPPHGPKFTILDALSATGLRALRYAQELPFVTSVTANDLTESAVESIRRNAEHNGVAAKINATHGDARGHMYSLLTEELMRDHAKERQSKQRKAAGSKRYDVIDLDPYGTAAPFLDAAVNAVRDDGGLLCVTCTDAGVWASNGYPEKSYALYGGIPTRAFWSHEAGLRLILHALATSAARYGLAIEPLLSLSIDYYARVFVRVRNSPAQVKFLAGKTMVVYNCDHGCGAFETQLLARNRKATSKKGTSKFYKHGFAQAPVADQHCKHCGSRMHLAGPMYAGPIHSPAFIRKILDDLPNVSEETYGTKPRIEGMLNTALEETILMPESAIESKEDEYAAIDPTPFFFHPTNLAGAIHAICPDENSIRGALRHLGYEVTRSHCKPGSMKTNAPWSVIWHIMRGWSAQKMPVNTAKIKETTAAYTLLRLGNKAGSTDDEVDKLEVKFDRVLGQDTSKKGLVRYQLNPRENWGPLSRATVVCILKRPNPQIGYDIFELQESKETEIEGSPFVLRQTHATEVAQQLLDGFLLNEIPEYLRSSSSRHVHVLVSTLSGTGLAVDFYQSVLGPLFRALGLTERERCEASTTAPNSYRLTCTQNADSVRDFARELGDQGRGGGGRVVLDRTVVLLSGDGGVAELLNGRAPADDDDDADDDADNDADDDDDDHAAPRRNTPHHHHHLPLVALLPLGTGNALFNSLHRDVTPITTTITATTAAAAAAAADSPGEPPSVLVQGLRTLLLRGRPAPLPSFKAVFSPGSRRITYAADREETPGEGEGGGREEEEEEQKDAVTHLRGAVVASYGLHAQLVWESDTPAWRRRGAARFGLVARELLETGHAYAAEVAVEVAGEQRKIGEGEGEAEGEEGGGGGGQQQQQQQQHAYVLAALVSHLERAFCVSPASRPLDAALRLVRFGPAGGGARALRVMQAAYAGGRHVDLPGVAYQRVDALTVRIAEVDPRWRKVCVDGVVVEVPTGGHMTVRVEGKPHLRVLVPRGVLGSRDG